MTTVADTRTLWRGPGIYTADELTLEQYHQDIVPGGSLSSSGARALLEPGCPAQFDHDRRHPQPAKKEWDLGTAAHKVVLGEGPDLVLVDVDDWRTKDARTQAADVRETGGVPLKRDEYEQVHAMADALRRHPFAAQVFDPTGGKPEQSLYWKDPESGVMCRARPDWLPNPGLGRLVIPDYKTGRDVSRDGVARAIHAWAYHCQAAWYLEGARALGLADDAAVFVLIFQQKTPPYIVTAAQVDIRDLRAGHAKNQVARAIYRECTDNGHWPGFVEGVEIIPQPEWARKREEEEYL